MILNYFKLYRRLRGGTWYLIITQERAKHVPHSYTFWHRGVFVPGQNVLRHDIIEVENYG